MARHLISTNPRWSRVWSSVDVERQDGFFLHRSFHGTGLFTKPLGTLSLLRDRDWPVVELKADRAPAVGRGKRRGFLGVAKSHSCRQVSADARGWRLLCRGGVSVGGTLDLCDPKGTFPL